MTINKKGSKRQNFLQNYWSKPAFRWDDSSCPNIRCDDRSSRFFRRDDRSGPALRWDDRSGSAFRRDDRWTRILRTCTLCWHLPVVIIQTCKSGREGTLCCIFQSFQSFIMQFSRLFWLVYLFESSNVSTTNANFVHQLWGCTSIYRQLSYPFRSLPVNTIWSFIKAGILRYNLGIKWWVIAWSFITLGFKY